MGGFLLVNNSQVFVFTVGTVRSAPVQKFRGVETQFSSLRR